jgi:two-component system phosphate regulon sensor histidine kinase PhoR
MILIKVKDNGLGMSKVAQKKSFEKFYREEHTGDLHNVKALGLAYVKRIVEDHNGQVYVEKREGKYLHN